MDFTFGFRLQAAARPGFGLVFVAIVASGQGPGSGNPFSVRALAPQR